MCAPNRPVATGQRGERGLRKMCRAEATVDHYDSEPV
jgi:hypothetical protein